MCELFGGPFERSSPAIPRTVSYGSYGSRSCDVVDRAGASTFKPHLHGWREWSGPLLCRLSSMGPGCAIFKLLHSYQDKSRQTVLGRETLFTPLRMEERGQTCRTRTRDVKKGPKVTIYFFSKRKPKSGKPMDEMPKNRKVGVNKRTGLPFLRKG